MAQAPDLLAHFLLALAAVIGLGGLLGRAFKRLGQSPVIGEVVAGILLGPSLLGRLWPEAEAFLLPASIAAPLGMAAQLGVILYMFQVGLDLNLSDLKGKGGTAVLTSFSSILLPLGLGLLLAGRLYGSYAPPGVPFAGFALFLGVAMSITAFPVLARILGDLKLSKTPLGVLALSCAAVDDVTAWCLLALVVGVLKADLGQAALAFAGLGVFAGLMFVLVRPLALKVSLRVDRKGLGLGTLAVVLWAVLVAALATEAIGIHAVFGAFLLGVLVPHESALAGEFKARFKDAVSVLLLPAFFAYTGMRTQINLVRGSEWGIILLIIGVATLGKFGGASLAGRFSGLSWRDSAALGILMNTRGMVELIALNIGLDLGVISPALFAMMVVMALVTTMATVPLLKIFRLS